MVWYRLFAADIIVSRLATQPLHGVGQLGVTSVKLKSHHLLRDWPILKIREKKILQSAEIAFQKRAILNFRLSGFPPCCCDKTATKNKAKTHLKHVLTGDPGIWLLKYNHTLSKASPYSIVLSRAQVSIPEKD